MKSSGAALALLLAICFPFGANGANPLSPFEVYRLKGGEFREGKNKVAKNLSGLACKDKMDGEKRHCLVVNDEDKFAQFATIEKNTVRPGRIVPLIGSDPSPATLGSPPNITCGTKDGFKDLDGEGVAYAKGYFYVAGSHGCSRKGHKLRLASFILARFKVDDKGEPVGIPSDSAPGTGVETTYRLSDALKGIPQFGQSLAGDGLNIEGISIVGDRLFAGLRAPSGYIVSASIDALFAPGSGALQDNRMEIIRWDLDQDTKGKGVRDIAALADGRLLILAGAVQEQKEDDPYLVILLSSDFKRIEKKWRLATVKHGEVAKAEALLILGQEPGELRILIMFDGIENGRPSEYVLK